MRSVTAQLFFSGWPFLILIDYNYISGIFLETLYTVFCTWSYGSVLMFKHWKHVFREGGGGSKFEIYIKIMPPCLTDYHLRSVLNKHHLFGGYGWPALTIWCFRWSFYIIELHLPIFIISLMVDVNGSRMIPTTNT